METKSPCKPPKTREDINRELAKFAKARLSEPDNAGQPCTMARHGEFTPHGKLARWECTACGGMSFRPTCLGAPPFCSNCGARCENVEDAEALHHLV